MTHLNPFLSLDRKGVNSASIVVCFIGVYVEFSSNRLRG